MSKEEEHGTVRNAHQASLGEKRACDSVPANPNCLNCAATTQPDATQSLLDGFQTFQVIFFPLCVSFSRPWQVLEPSSCHWCSPPVGGRSQSS